MGAISADIPLLPGVGTLALGTEKLTRKYPRYLTSRPLLINRLERLFQSSGWENSRQQAKETCPQHLAARGARGSGQKGWASDPLSLRALLNGPSPRVSARRKNQGPVTPCPQTGPFSFALITAGNCLLLLDVPFPNQTRDSVRLGLFCTLGFLAPNPVPST